MRTGKGRPNWSWQTAWERATRASRQELETRRAAELRSGRGKRSRDVQRSLPPALLVSAGDTQLI